MCVSQILMDSDTDALVFSPPAESFFQSLAEVQVSFVEQVKVVGRLLIDPKMQVGHTHMHTHAHTHTHTHTGSSFLPAH